MLRPQDTATRERKSLNGLWRFALDPDASGRADGWFRGPLPGRPGDGRAGQLQRHRRRRRRCGTTSATSGTRPPCGCRAAGTGSGSSLHFESATHRATVWVDDAEVVSHEGGYTPFEADVTDHVRAGEQARITVVVNNTLSFQTIPPGVIEDTPDGKRQRYWHDFFNYAGIHRTVWLYATAAAAPHRHHRRHRPGRRHRHRRLHASRPQGADGAEVRVVLRDADGQPRSPPAPARAGTLTVPNVHRWAPGDGYLYDLEVQLVDGTADCRGQLPPERRRPDGRGGRHPVPDQRRAVLLHRLRQARGPRR